MQKESKTFSRKKGRIFSLFVVFALAVFSLMLSVSSQTAYGADTPWLEKTSVTLPSSDDYAYSYMVVGDTQYVTMYDTKYNTTYLNQTYKWIADNASSLKTKYVIGMGDITHNDTESEFKVAQTAIKQLDGVVPYALIRGNHDNRAYFYDKYFGPTVTTGDYASTYMKQSSIVSYFTQSDDSTRLYSTVARNTAHEFSVGDTKYLLINLDFGAQDPVLDWANNLVSQTKYANHNVIVSTHGYIASSGAQLDGALSNSPSLYENSYVNSSVTVANPFISGGDKVHFVENAKADKTLPFNDGDDIWNKFVRKHANIKAVFCGHVLANNIVKSEMVGDNGNIVQQIVINPQAIDDDEKDNGTDGYKSLTGMVAIVYCSADGQTQTVRWYSTIKDKYYGEQNQFDLRWNARKWANGEGMSFSANKLYSMKSPITSFPRTIEVVAKYSKPSNNQMLVASYRGYRSNTEMALRVLSGSGNISLFYHKATEADKTLDFGVSCADGNYHHIAVTLDDTNAYLYVDGKLEVTKAHGWGAIADLEIPDDTPISIGGDYRNGNTGYFSAGSIKSVAITKDIRTQSEIAMDAKFTSSMDSDLLLSVDLVDISASATAITNMGDNSNPVVVAKIIFSANEGMTFSKNKVYLMKKSLSAFPKTIEVNMKYTIPTGNQMVISSFGDNTLTQIAIRVLKDTGYIGVYYRDTAEKNVVFDKIPTTVSDYAYGDNKYYSYAFTFDDTNAYCYVDGVLAQTVAHNWGSLANVSIPNGIPYGIGGDARGGNGGAFVNGAIKWATIYSDVRTASEISAMVSNEAFVYDENALVAVDMSSGVTGGHIANYADGTNILYSQGKSFTATQVNKVASTFTQYPVSVEAVIRGSGATSGNGNWIVGNYASDATTSFGIRYTSANKINVYMCGSKWANTNVTFDTVLPTIRYVHIAVTLDGANANFYIDGELKETKAFEINTAWATKWNNALPMVVGGDNRSGNTCALTTATIQSVAIYSTCLSAGDIKNSYNNGINPNATGLLAGYDFGGYNDKTVYKNLNGNGAPLVASNHNFNTNETFLDIASYGVNEENYVWGQEHTSTQNYRLATYKLWDYDVKGNTNANIGIEFRFKSRETKAQLSSLMSAQSYTGSLWAFMNIRLGHTFFEINLPNDLSQLAIRTAHFGTTVASNSLEVKTMMLYGSSKNVIAYEDGAEYVFRFTRTAIDATIDNGYGALLRVYVGKIDPETNMPQANWDATPVVEEFALYERNSNIANECGISVEPGYINHNTAMPHTVIISSNKYCGVKVDGVMTKHERGTEFAFAGDSDTTDNTFLIGYSAGATTYSADDFVVAGGKKVVTSNAEYKSMSVTIQADENATARFRNRVVSGKVQPLELALNWGANATFTNNLDTYFSVKFGYNLTASNGATSGDIEVSKVVDNAFSVTQSNIGSEYYDLKFAFRAYVEINGTKYYTAEIDADNGDSVSAIASELVSELASESTANKTNAIKENGQVIGYHYLTQSQYDLAKQIILA